MALAAACASSQARPEGAAAAPEAGVAPAQGAQATVQPRRVRADRTTITQEEIAQNGQASATLYDFVIARHNDWLRSTGGGRMTQSVGNMDASAGPVSSASRAVSVTVYIDGIRFGVNPEALRNIPLRTVALARRLSPSEAQAKYGSDNDAGTIEVWTSLDRVR
ncbi:MAG: hypothetical protein A2085_02310 [Gemmatimonadetes bacterium GWC2_71_10]|nr:MAG: hypothetical protein A2085_02310 [Gemmatimonadetes bacterium GWC2_71_10]